jgi:hypothetical protein
LTIQRFCNLNTVLRLQASMSFGILQRCISIEYFSILILASLCSHVTFTIHWQYVTPACPSLSVQNSLHGHTNSQPPCFSSTSRYCRPSDSCWWTLTDSESKHAYVFPCISFCFLMACCNSAVWVCSSGSVVKWVYWMQYDGSNSSYEMREK